MKSKILKMITASLALSVSAILTACDVDKTQEGKLPDVDVDVEGGQLPKYDVDAPDVDVKMKEKMVTVPVPDVDLTPPPQDDQNNNAVSDPKIAD